MDILASMNTYSLIEAYENTYSLLGTYRNTYRPIWTRTPLYGLPWHTLLYGLIWSYTLLFPLFGHILSHFPYLVLLSFLSLSKHTKDTQKPAFPKKEKNEKSWRHVQHVYDYLKALPFYFFLFVCPHGTLKHTLLCRPFALPSASAALSLFYPPAD